MKGISFSNNESFQCNKKYPVRVTANTSNIANRVNKPSRIKTGKNKFEATAKHRAEERHAT